MPAWLLNYDFYPTQFQVNLKEKSEKSSYLGVIMSTIVVALTGFAIYQLLEGFILGRKPLIYQYNTILNAAEISTYEDLDLDFSFHHEALDKEQDETYFTYALKRFSRIDGKISFSEI